MKDIVNKLTENNKTISTMESCTGGAIANEITSVEGSSEVLKFSAVTYSNEFKIRMGVDSEVIDKFTVYSIEVAREMSKKITEFTLSNYGVGVTGRINRIDASNLVGGDSSKIYICVYDRETDSYFEREVNASKATRKENKELIVEVVVNLLNSVL